MPSGVVDSLPIHNPSYNVLERKPPPQKKCFYFTTILQVVENAAFYFLATPPNTTEWRSSFNRALASRCFYSVFKTKSSEGGRQGRACIDNTGESEPSQRVLSFCSAPSNEFFQARAEIVMSHRITPPRKAVHATNPIALEY